MKYDYLSLIKRSFINNKVMFKLSDVKNYMISDINEIKYKVNEYISNFNLNSEYIDLYTLILLISFSNDYRSFKYKFFLCYNTIDKINDIIHPDVLIDKVKTFNYFNPKDRYSFKRNNISNNSGCIKDIILKEIENSFNIDIIRQII